MRNTPARTAERVCAAVLAGGLAVAPALAGADCPDPGPDAAPQTTSPAVNFSGVACAPTGVTTANTYGRVIEGFASGEIRCVTSGFFNTGPAVGAVMGLYHDIDGGAPTAIGTDLVLIAEGELVVPATPQNVSFLALAFDPPICVEDYKGALVVVVEIAAQSSGFTSIGANASGETGPTYLLSDACGIASFTALAALGYPDFHWVVSVNGDLAECGGGGTPCPADLDGDGSVGASDLAILLGAWGGSGPADLDGDNSVGASDLAILLGAWGSCPQ